MGSRGVCRSWQRVCHSGGGEHAGHAGRRRYGPEPGTVPVPACDGRGNWRHRSPSASSGRGRPRGWTQSTLAWRALKRFCARCQLPLGWPAGKPDDRCRSAQVRSPTVRVLPVAEPGTPAISTPWRYLGWPVGQQKGGVALGVLWGCTWMVAQSIVPAVIGAAVDALIARQTHLFAADCVVVLGLGVITAVSGVLRHRWSHAAAGWPARSSRFGASLVR